MKNSKGSGTDGIPTEAFKHLGDLGVCQITNIFNTIMQSGKMSDEWKIQGHHCHIKLLTPTMQLWERTIGQSLRDIVSISDGQFGFRPGVGATDATFVTRNLCDHASRYNISGCTI